MSDDVYANVYFLVEKHCWERRPKSGLQGIRLLHDHGWLHKTKLVKSELERMRIVVLKHPPCLPDHAPVISGSSQSLQGQCRQGF